MSSSFEIGNYNPAVLLRNLSVCYLDNEQDHLDELVEVIDPHRFKNFIATANPEEAIGLAKSKKVDILICDFKMPKNDGLHILRICNQENPDLKMILYTGYVLTPPDIDICNKLNIHHVKKLDINNLIITISILANEIKDLDESFNEVTVSLPDEKAISSTFHKPLIEVIKSRDKLPVDAILRDNNLYKDSLKRIAKDLIDDYRKIPNKSEVLLYISNNEKLTAAEMLEELENLTEKGLNHLISWVEANIFINREIDKKNT